MAHKKIDNATGRVDVKENAYLAAFNEIAGAPDWEGGSGRFSSIYFLNDERTEYIVVSFGDIRYFDIRKQDKNKPYVFTPIKGQVVEPGLPFVPNDDLMREMNEKFWESRTPEERAQRHIFPYETPTGAR